MSTLKNTFRAPKGVTQFQTITISELSGAMERDAGHWADMRIAEEKIKPDDMVGRFRIEREEDIRASIVAVDGKVVNAHGAPFKGFDAWPKKVRQVVVARFFDAMNSVDSEDLEKCVAEVMNPESPGPSSEGASTAEPKGG